jgi:hypothetical protein
MPDEPRQSTRSNASGGHVGIDRAHGPGTAAANFERERLQSAGSSQYVHVSPSMSQSMQIPADWLAEAGVQNFAPPQLSFRCDAPDAAPVPLADIEPPLRFDSCPLDANGFDHKRMVRLLVGIRDDVALPPIYIEIADPGQRKYRVRAGVHRYHASLALRFSHVPAEIVPRIY